MCGTMMSTSLKDNVDDYDCDDDNYYDRDDDDDDESDDWVMALSMIVTDDARMVLKDNLLCAPDRILSAWLPMIVCFR